MDIRNFTIDEHGLLRTIRRWVECESPSWDSAAVSRMTALAATQMRNMGARIQMFEGKDGYGDAVLGDFAGLGAGPGILILGHLDTVHPIGSLAGPMPWRENAGRCYAPGVFDMKSGNCMALQALAGLRTEAFVTPLPVRVLLTSDEESGSPSTRGLIEHIARGQKYVLVPEGAQPNGNLVSGRFPSRRLQLWTRGRPSHALLQRAEGHSALAAMAKIVLAIEALNADTWSLTVVHMNAGRTVATVPVEAYAEMVCTARSADALDRAVASVRGLASLLDACELELRVKTERPTWTPAEPDRALWAHAEALSRQIGFPLDSEMLFGGSDGNFTGALGIATLDGLGAVGADAHQQSEHIDLASLVPRTRLLAGLLATLE